MNSMKICKYRNLFHQLSQGHFEKVSESRDINYTRCGTVNTHSVCILSWKFSRGGTCILFLIDGGQILCNAVIEFLDILSYFYCTPYTV